MSVVPLTMQHIIALSLCMLRLYLFTLLVIQ